MGFPKTDVVTDRLRTSGAVLYYEVRGRGPLILISQSGEGDAGRSADLVEHLAAAYSVVTYDRRGLSRSVMDEPTPGVTMRDHAQDVHELLRELSDEPVPMLGCSLGASIGLHLAVDHPEQISTLIAHEPVTPRLLPSDQRARHEHELSEIQQVHRTDGMAATFRLIAEVLGIDPADTDVEPGRTPQPMTPQRLRNFAFFVEHDFSAIIGDTLDVGALRNTTTRILPVVGAKTPETVFDHKCAVALAELVGRPLHTFPGGHNGNTSHPKAYAAAVFATLASQER